MSNERIKSRGSRLSHRDTHEDFEQAVRELRNILALGHVVQRVMAHGLMLTVRSDATALVTEAETLTQVSTGDCTNFDTLADRISRAVDELLAIVDSN